MVGPVAPTANPTDGRLPSEVPEIMAPAEGTVTGEREIAVTVSVPEDPLPRRLLTLEVVRDGVILKSEPRPVIGTDVVVEGVRLDEGPNVLTAVLRGPGGAGPASEPVTVALDRTPPDLTVSAPRENRKTTEPNIAVTGTSEPGATVGVRNATRGWEDPAVVGPSGSFEMLVPLSQGRNRIVIRATDPAGNVRRITRFVEQQDGRPVVRLKAPKSVKVASLPTNIRIQARVSDADGEPIQGADIVFSITVPGQGSEIHEGVTNPAGRSNWRPSIGSGGRRGDIIIVNAQVTAPNGQQRKASVEIPYS